MYTTSRWIFGVRDIQFFCKSRHSGHITYRIHRWISAVLDIQFFCKSNHSLHIWCVQFPVEFLEFWIFNFLCKSRHSVHIQCTQFPVKFSQFGLSIFYKFRHSVRIMYTISHRICGAMAINFYSNPNIPYV